MKIPRLFIGVVTIFWGFESGNLPIAICIAIFLESSHFISKKWELTEADFVRISDFTSVIFLATLALILLNVETRFFLKVLIKWAPLINLPLIIAQLYSSNEKIIIGTQLGRKKKRAHVHHPMEFTFPYCVICIFSAAIANSRSDIFFPCMALLFAWLLFVNRGKAYSLVFFCLFFTGIAGLGFFGFQGAERAHDYISWKMHKLIRGYYWDKYADPFVSHLSFGSLKNMKNSSRIIIRLQTDGQVPFLLKQASYDTFNKNNWHSRSKFTYLPTTNYGWQLLPQTLQAPNKATIELALPKEKGLLPFPPGSFWVEGEALYELGKNPSGIIQIINAATMVTYDINFHHTLKSDEDLPTFRNLQIPDDEEYAIDHLADDLQMHTLSHDQLLPVLVDYFQNNFVYSLDISQGKESPTYLGSFLIHDRKGYCEMFATATTLLLRKAGIPSRYVTGYLVFEYSELESKYIVRQRHAHAWTEAFIEGQWETVDSTPAAWPELEQQNASFFEPLRDFFSIFRWQFEHFRVQSEQRYNLVLSCIIVLLTGILGYRVYRRMQAKNMEERTIRAKKMFSQTETPFTRLETRLTDTGVSRGQGESFMAWVRRINDLAPIGIDDIKKLYAQHQVLRFDPQNAPKEVTEELEGGVAQWFTNNPETKI